ncbi:hypothetical protein RRG08_049997 [Elysia crispata]|uniref:Uncharacterized protein n=1 Tax=Elysia crispata TaxID=231223 RepID=A0AAE1BBE2_9GAST|nr:hypothetical protein RRG08_049997 [Elysia crispata]
MSSETVANYPAFSREEPQLIRRSGHEQTEIMTCVPQLQPGHIQDNTALPSSCFSLQKVDSSLRWTRGLLSPGTICKFFSLLGCLAHLSRRKLVFAASVPFV